MNLDQYKELVAGFKKREIESLLEVVSYSERSISERRPPFEVSGFLALLEHILR